MTIYKACEACSGARTSGAWEDAYRCRSCDGKGIVRTRESWVCNRCGGCMCPAVENANGNAPHGLVETKVSGGYDSPALSDGTTYTFSICETCLRELFATFKVQPTVFDYMGGGQRDETYAEETAAMEAQRAAEEARAVERAVLHTHGRCTEKAAEGDGFCGRHGVIYAVSGEVPWDLCAMHGRDAVMWHHATVAGMTWQERVSIGLRYFTAFEMGDAIQPLHEIEASIFISTLFPLVSQWETSPRAVAELERLTRAKPEPCTAWVNGRVALHFPPGSSEGAVANSWLAWGRKEGYANATAAAFLGYSVERMWE